MTTPAVRNMNPGNLKDPNTGAFQTFSDPSEGKAALYNDLTAKMTGKSSTGLNGESSLMEFAKTYAPASDKNDPIQYAANLANKLGVSPDTKIGTLAPRIDDFASAVSSNEDPSVTYTPTNKTDSQQPYNPTPFSKPETGQFDFSGLSTPIEQPKEKGVMDNLIDRSNQIGTSVKQAVRGEINPLSGIFQTAGGVAGGINDITNGILENTPIVGTFLKGIEGIVGTGVKSFLGTDAGKAVAQSVSEFTKEHPELSDDIGAGVNVISAIPILKGFGVVKNIALDAGAMALKRTAEKNIIGDMSEVLAKTKAGKEILQNAPEHLETSVQNRALPEIVKEGGERLWSTEKASKIMDDAISSVDDELTAELAKGQTTRIADRLPIKSLEEQSVKKAIDESIDPSGIKNFFKNVLNVKYPDGFLTLDQINLEKRLIARKIKEAAFGDPLMTTNKALRKTFQTAVEDGAKSLGLKDVNEINKRMAEFIKTQDMLDLINMKPVAEKGLVHQAMKVASTASGEAIGRSVGTPVLGGILGLGATKYVEGKLGGIMGKGLTQNILKRTAPGAVRQTVSGTIKAGAKATAGLLSQKGVKK